MLRILLAEFLEHIMHRLLRQVSLNSAAISCSHVMHFCKLIVRWLLLQHAQQAG
jgi:hypothetical protein